MQASYIDEIRAALGAGPDGPSTREIAHALITERDALRARLAIYEKDGVGVVPVNGGRCVEVYQDGEMVEIETSEAGDEVITLRARVAELEAHELKVSRLTGIVYEADYHCHAGPRDQVLGEIARLKTEARDALELRQRVAELEAPPVVPEGWRVALGTHWTLWLVHEDGGSPDEECARISVGDKWLVVLDGASAVAPWEALAALEYAHRTGQRPPHAGDE